MHKNHDTTSHLILKRWFCEGSLAIYFDPRVCFLEKKKHQSSDNSEAGETPLEHPNSRKCNVSSRQLLFKSYIQYRFDS